MQGLLFFTSGDSLCVQHTSAATSSTAAVRAVCHRTRAMISAAARPCVRGTRSLVRGRAGNTVYSRLISASTSERIAGSSEVLKQRRSMSSSEGNPGPGVISGFGRRQKPVDSGNTALGKGFDLMEDDPGSRKKVVIDGYDNHGFQLTDGVDVRGSMICLPNSYVLWEPKRSSDITVESLLLLELVIPKIDLLIIGVGKRMTERLSPDLVTHLRSKGISVEQMDTVNACSTFNVLNAEDRRVAVALIQLSVEGETSE